MSTSQEFYALVAEWIKLPPFGLEFKYKGKMYKIVGVVQAGNKLRAECDGQIFLFKARDFAKNYLGESK
jgi:hypothetical protein